MRAEKYWDHDPFFDYVDRWMETEDIHATAKVILDAARAAGPSAAAYAKGTWILKQPRSPVGERR